VIRKMGRVEQEHNVIGILYYRVDNSRGQRKTRVVSPVIGQAGCPGRETDCLKPAGTRVGVSARMYNDSNSLGDRVKEGRGDNTGTRDLGRE